jgi:hypothetical protein
MVREGLFGVQVRHIGFTCTSARNRRTVLCVLWLPAILLSWFLCMHMLHGSSIFWWQPARLPRASPEDPPTITNHGPEIIFLNHVTKMETQNVYRDRGTSLTMFNPRCLGLTLSS